MFLILSYRASLTYNTENCSCHPRYLTEKSSFELRVCESIEEAGEYIASRLWEGPHADHFHAVLESFEAGLNHGYSEGSEIKIVGEKYNGYPQQYFIPGHLTWPNKYDECDYEHHEERDAEANRIEQFYAELVKIIETQYMQRHNKEKRGK